MQKQFYGTALWGAFEFDAFSRGTYAMVDVVTSSHASTIVGGGDTDMAFHKSGKTHEVSFISTGGGAFLKLLGRWQPSRYRIIIG